MDESVTKWNRKDGFQILKRSLRKPTVCSSSSSFALLNRIQKLLVSDRQTNIPPCPPKAINPTKIPPKLIPYANTPAPSSLFLWTPTWLRTPPAAVLSFIHLFMSPFPHQITNVLY
ncbi:hypothetical protein B0T17DRAFT_39130 [Bombardia bombarda]|uniref:Uncharacterized protein n=1 Tax=Bombardia bombarda TaxID=252184 RepID=A0AA40CFC1_9PEZI|nr:hypothetical protein B0T17DRAFT_39130 [Bombardia bombarda]